MVSRTEAGQGGVPESLAPAAWGHCSPLQLQSSRGQGDSPRAAAEVNEDGPLEGQRGTSLS